MRSMTWRAIFARPYQALGLARVGVRVPDHGLAADQRLRAQVQVDGMLRRFIGLQVAVAPKKASGMLGFKFQADGWFSYQWLAREARAAVARGDDAEHAHLCRRRM